ncbi:hypothetical protein C2G38_2026985 [Gigaspora rosea]|uniref:Protein kinase domain-containing protein n=1 Tax=Gigaspora rosea TaxID=44941 RepID=A0A397W689_9GLOM|nr:hypothetical protein C2G38_2026985 [Gigaspora rosea]
MTSTAYGMPAYIDPKYLDDSNYKRNKKSDVYSIGVILWEISSGRPPFSSIASVYKLASQILKGDREKPIEDTPPQYIELYKKCWDEDPANRPETRIILNTLKKLILEDLRKETRKYFRQRKFLKALELFEEILRNIQHSPDDQRCATTWDYSYYSYNKCGLENLNELTKVLYKNSKLTSLNLRENNLGSEGGKALADALCKNSTLTSLYLQYNELGSEGEVALVYALCKNSTMTSLNFYMNYLGPEGVKALVDELWKNSMLTSLNLHEGGKAFANTLCKNSTLRFLNLGYNNLGSKGGKALADANSTLTSLDLENNDIGLEGGKSLAGAVCKNSTLTYLDL